MGAKPKTASWFSRNKVLLIAVGVILLVLVLLSTLYYQSQRPNYRDLESEFSKLQIPDDWKLESVADNKGKWGLFCWQLSDSSCPQLFLRFRVPIDNNDVIDSVTQLLGPTFSVVESECLNSEKIACTGTFKNGDVYVRVVSSKDNDEQITVNLIFGNKNGFGA